MHWLKYLCLLAGGLLLAGILLGGAWAGLKIAFYSQQDNEIHLAEKAKYPQQVSELPASADRPNIVFILFDDLGYGGLGFTGNRTMATPAMDQLARDGVVRNNFYSPAPVCTPARAGFLTGRLPLRAAMPSVVFPIGHAIDHATTLGGANKRIPAEEITPADVLQVMRPAWLANGTWVTALSPCPTRWDSRATSARGTAMIWKPLPCIGTSKLKLKYRPTRPVSTNGTAMPLLTEQYSEAPFFLYFAHNFPHIPLFRPAQDEGRFKTGRYGDVIEGLDDVVARVVNTLKSEGV